MLSAEFEPAFPASGRTQTNALDRAATAISTSVNSLCQIFHPIVPPSQLNFVY